MRTKTPSLRFLLPLATAGVCTAQSAPAAFDAVSIHPSAPGQGVSVGRNDPGRLAFANVTALRLIQLAYGVQPPAIVGPHWLATDGFDVIATTSAPLTRAAMLPMLQGVLAQRFAMKVHRETRTVPVFQLEVEHPGKLQPAGTDFKCDSPSEHGLNQIAGTEDMARLANALANQTGRPVIEATGLSGEFNLCFGYARDAGAHPDAPDLFAALREQLGLRLVAKSAPVEVLVIDAIERPTPN